ncbi:Ion transport peptide-like like protein [Argiope bruennichi]|uniref:Ion transport peptide-like like protein n=1 Tax=Argiope bruennichi TaxID=94029 RepID=A0A8T0E3F9_ARGBR|nr:Ion transport peptide-like like protein [Argiope bruennichi]
MRKLLGLTTFAVIVTVIFADLQGDFAELGCKGTFDESKLRTVIRVCDDCYDLFREDTMLKLCRQKCFTTSYFSGCLDSTEPSADKAYFEKIVKDLSG